jgi:hypothetical protein
MSELLQFFAYEHLPAHLQTVSKPFGESARALAALSPEDLKRGPDVGEPACKILYELSLLMDTGHLPCNVEATYAIVKIGEAKMMANAGKSLDTVLRRLLEAKDCAVRALVFKAG